MTTPTRRRDDQAEWQEGLDPDGPSAEDLDRFGGKFRACPSCGEEVYDQTELCHHCGHALSERPRGLPLWAIFTAIAVLAAFLLFFVF